MKKEGFFAARGESTKHMVVAHDGNVVLTPL
jgi:hypothetical protein